MNLSINANMNAIILIILGIISLSFPLVMTMTFGVLSGFIFLMVSLLLFITASNVFKYNRTSGILSLILAIICLIFSLLIIFSPSAVSIFTGFLVYIIGFIMILDGIFYIILAKSFKPLSIMGIITLIFGILYIIIGSYIYNPVNLGIVIGIWLLLTGLLSLLSGN